MNDISDAPIAGKMTAVLESQRADFLKEGFVTAETRIDRLERAIDMLINNSDRLLEALNSDYSGRPREVSVFTDLGGSLASLKHAKSKVRKWMKPEKRPTVFPLNLLGGRSRVEYQPLGVVGVIAPWNFPVNLIFSPLAQILAAGNRAMIKPSEYTPATSVAMAEMIAQAFDTNEIAIFDGGPEVGQAFSALPFDHLLFTGATSVARHILTAAAENLVPTTLELGGKSPVVISRSADIEESLTRVMFGKLMNAGQICIAPDYLMVPEEKLDSVVSAAESAVTAMFPSIIDNPSYTSIINERHYNRLAGYVTQAEERGQQVIAINPANEDFSAQQDTRKMAPTLIPAPADDLDLMQDEIFGPVLPIRTYKSFEETIQYINSRPRPLAAYYFGKDKAEEQSFTSRTTSGGVCINDVIIHASQEELPFGGVGPSGTGAYHGFEGFRRFSHAKGIFKQAKVDVAKLGGVRPPYGKTTESTIAAQLKR